MNKEEIKRIVADILIKKILERFSICYVPVAASNRHVHLSQTVLERLFGKGYTLKPVRDLVQPGQFACEERISVVGSKGAINGVRVLGPVRKETQVEISVTDSYTLGIKPVVRMSGDLDGTPGCKLVGPAGECYIENGVIVSARHLHISDDEAKYFGLKDGDKVNIRKPGERSLVFNDVIVRAGMAHKLEFHVDTDEANAAAIRTGEFLKLEKPGTGKSISNVNVNERRSKSELITEKVVNKLHKNGQKTIYLGNGVILTPLAKDRAGQLGLEIIYKS